MNSTAQPIDPNALFAPIAQNMPEPTGAVQPPSAPESATAQPPPVEPPTASAPTPESVMGRDSLNRPFDLKKFRPEKDILGRWKNLRGGKGGGKIATAPKPPRVKAEPPPPAATAQPPPVEPPAPTASLIPPDDAPSPVPAIAPGEDRFALAAETYLRAGYCLLDGAFAGKGEWMPDDTPEHDALKASLAVWLRSRNSEDLPPGAAFALCAVGYAAKRVQRPNTATRWRLWWLSLRAWWGNRQAQAKLAQIAPETSPPSP